jgi:hypothetical protein
MSLKEMIPFLGGRLRVEKPPLEFQFSGGSSVFRVVQKDCA